MSIRSIAMTVACSVAGLLSVSEAKADPYYWGAGYGWGGFGYSTYYAPTYYGGYYSSYYPSYWSGYSPYFSASFYAPSYAYAAYPAYYGFGSACCAPSCCDACGPGGCGAAGCGVPDRAPGAAKSPVPDSGPPKTYEGEDDSSKFKPRDGGPAQPAPTTPAPTTGDEPEKQETFKPPTSVETDKPEVIPQKKTEEAPSSAPLEGIPSSPDVIRGPKSTTPPSATPAPTPAPAEEKKEDAKPATKVDVEDIKPEGNVHPAPLKFDGKVTWRTLPSRARLASKPAVRITQNVRHANRNWVPVSEATVVKK